MGPMVKDLMVGSGTGIFLLNMWTSIEADGLASVGPQENLWVVQCVNQLENSFLLDI